MPYRILVVADLLDAREGLISLIGEASDLTVCCDAATTEAALSAIAISVPDLVIAEATRPEPDGIKLTQLIRAANPEIPVLVVSTREEEIDAAHVLRVGARGVISVPSPSEAILSAIRSVLLGHVVLPESVRDQFLAPSVTNGSGPVSAEHLSRRQLEVLRHIGQGMTTTEIADTLDISPKTVETHRVNIKNKLNFDTANALIRWAALWVGHDQYGS
jgi:DNA-binding NarL/FixJ family response regulator